jgi:putative transcriptional regulator
MIAPRLKLVDCRKELGLTQEELAKEVEISRAYLVNIEKGKYTPSLQVAQKLSMILGKSVDELFF